MIKFFIFCLEGFFNKIVLEIIEFVYCRDLNMDFDLSYMFFFKK